MAIGAFQMCVPIELKCATRFRRTTTCTCQRSRRRGRPRWRRCTYLASVDAGALAATTAAAAAAATNNLACQVAKLPKVKKFIKENEVCFMQLMLRRGHPREDDAACVTYACCMCAPA